MARLADPAGGAVLAIHATKAAALVERGVTMRDIHRWEGIAFCDGIDPEGNVVQITTRR